jgi:ribonuclease E
VSTEVEALETTEAPAGEEAVATGERAEGEDREGRGRRGRGRDRYRRERREGETIEGGAVQGMEPAAATEAVAAQAKPWWEASGDAGSIVAAPAATVAETVPILEAAPAPIVVEPFVLPTDDLQRVAEAAGLQWVNSDADKIRAVQEAMANEPQPIHVPRERKPMALIDEGPLVLVETRKDLSQLKLPFDASQAAPH